MPTTSMGYIVNTFEHVMVVGRQGQAHIQMEQCGTLYGGYTHVHSWKHSYFSYFVLAELVELGEFN